MKNEITSTRSAVLNYYAKAEKGYWDDLGGVCHYGYSAMGETQPFDMRSAQLEMERLLGKTLNLPAGSHVLDAGCGYGPVVRTLTTEFQHRVTGIDLIARRLRRNSPHHNSLVNADYHHLPFADGSFDGICTMETLVHAHDYRQVLSEFKRVLRPGGTIALFEYTIPPLESVPWPARQLAERVIRNTGMTSLPYFTHGSFPDILGKVGFTGIQSRDISKHVHRSWYHLWRLALKATSQEFAHGRISLDNVPGSAWIWPARHQLGYAVTSASKPQL